MNPNTNTEQKVLEVRDLRVEYLTDRGSVTAVDRVSFDIKPGEVFGLAGESGCGKSTIAHSILRVLRPPAVITGGEILYKGVNVLEMDEMSLEEFREKILTTSERKDIATRGNAIESFRWAEVSMVIQSAMNSLNPVIRISDQLVDVLMKHEKLNKKQARERAGDLLEVVNIDRKRLDAYPHELSGGMRQRVVIAMALALKPSLMIMDEPTTALDVVVQKDILQQIEELKKNLGFSILFITHDLSLMVEFSDRIGIMYAGKMVELASSKEILTNPLHPYTQGLLASFPSITGPKEKLSGIPGSPPNLLYPPTGCRYHDRCGFWDTGMLTEPVLEEVAPGHWVACTCRHDVIMESLAQKGQTLNSIGE